MKNARLFKNLPKLIFFFVGLYKETKINQKKYGERKIVGIKLKNQINYKRNNKLFYSGLQFLMLQH